MLTYSADDLRTLRHDRPPLRAVRKAIFSAHLWRSRATRQSADHSDVNNKSADRDRRLRIGWLNVRLLAKNAAAVCESIQSNNLDVCGSMADIQSTTADEDEDEDEDEEEEEEVGNHRMKI